MSAVTITNVIVLDNRTPFVTPFHFEISYQCITPLKQDLEWKLIYVGSAEDESYDQLSENVFAGPVNVGYFHFVLQVDPPDPSKILPEDIIGVTVLLLSCSYLGEEFVRVGYYVENKYDDEQLRKAPPQHVLIDKVRRSIVSDKPRITKFPINSQPEDSDCGEQASDTPRVAKFPINFQPEDSDSGEQTTPPVHSDEADENEELPSASDHPSDEDLEFQ